MMIGLVLMLVLVLLENSLTSNVGGKRGCKGNHWAAAAAASDALTMPWKCSSLIFPFFGSARTLIKLKFHHLSQVSGCGLVVPELAVVRLDTPVDTHYWSSSERKRKKKTFKLLLLGGKGQLESSATYITLFSKKRVEKKQEAIEKK